MSKVFLTFCLFLISCTAFAEENGVFLGFGFGMHDAKQEIKGVERLSSNIKSIDSTTDFGSGIYIGYKSMLNENSAWRAYVNIDQNQVEVEKPNGKTGFRMYDIIGYNVDFMFNFTQNFGMFVGANFAAIIWDKEIWSIDIYNDDDEYNSYIAAQLGLRAMFGEKQRHSVELFSKMPFTKTIFEYELNGVKIASMKLRQNYTVLLRYIYTFSY